MAIKPTVTKTPTKQILQPFAGHELPTGLYDHFAAWLIAWLLVGPTLDWLVWSAELGTVSDQCRGTIIRDDTNIENSMCTISRNESR